ncbi:MAG: VWA domain-containing protein [Planctomycetes bacterium]|nr:VWA domain-containing protein [Planctomycetota bacterium]
MRRFLAVLIVALTGAESAQARGILIPTEKTLPPLAMLNHKVDIAIEDQVAITRVEQTFRNHTDRQLEATYIFPVPKGATVRKLTMWIDGKETPGELVEAAKARAIYTSIVQRSQDPALLESMGNDLFRLRVFPILPRSDQKISISYTSVADKDNGVIEYIYPLKHDSKAISTLEKFSIKVDLRSQLSLQNIYSPSHAITMQRPNDKHAVITFEKDAAVLDRDFQLFYTAGAKDVGLTSLVHRPTESNPGYFMLLVSPRAELSKSQQVPRDMIFVLDTSGSMRGKRMTQARGALKYCLSNLNPQDGFAVINFATTVNRYTEKLLIASSDNIGEAQKWVDALEATGGTAIQDALLSALELRPSENGRTFTIVFFTDGRATIGETNEANILKNVLAKNSANTRIFTFGVGDDVNASMLDQLAEQSRAISSYVREAEDIESKVSALYGKISNPVLTGLKLSVDPSVKISEVYPPELPDLFHGTQLVIMGRYTGKDKVKVKLTGNVGKAAREFVYEVAFADKTPEDKPFVEDLWARRKVGFLLEQIRRNGEKKELVEEVVTLAKRYGITTPYTSYLIVPDSATPIAGGIRRPVDPAAPPAFLRGGDKDGKKLEEVARRLGQGKGKAGPGGAGGIAGERGEFQDERLKREADEPASAPAAKAALESKKALDKAKMLFDRRDFDGVQTGKLGVDLSVRMNELRNQTRTVRTATRLANGRNCLEVGGVWIDDGFNPKMKIVAVKAMSKAYFRILELQPRMREVLSLGNYVIWVAPSGTALIIDLNSGREEMPDADIDRVFTRAKE